jgi:hypothetical protein
MVTPMSRNLRTTKTLLAAAEMTRQAFKATVQSADMQVREKCPNDKDKKLFAAAVVIARVRTSSR